MQMWVCPLRVQAGLLFSLHRSLDRDSQHTAMLLRGIQCVSQCKYVHIDAQQHAGEAAQARAQQPHTVQARVCDVAMHDVVSCCFARCFHTARQLLVRARRRRLLQIIIDSGRPRELRDQQLLH